MHVVRQTQGRHQSNTLGKAHPFSVNSFSCPWMHRHYNGKLIFGRNAFNDLYKLLKLLGRIDIFFTMGANDKVVVLSKAKLREDLGTIEFLPVMREHLVHRAARLDYSVWCDPLTQKILAGYLAVGEIDVAYMIHNPTVNLLGDPLVEAPVSRLHVEDGNLQSLCRQCGQATVCITEYQHRIRLYFGE